MLRNLTLAAMDQSDLAVFIPSLTEKTVNRGELLSAQGEKISHVYFPTTAYLVNTITYSDGRSAETFVMGVEGVSGLAAFAADSPCAWAVEVKLAGSVFRLPAELLRRQIEVSPGLRRLLRALNADYQTQAACGVACATLHSTTPRLARLLLEIADRTCTEELHLTQEDVAGLLGVQRTTVNASAIELKEAGLVAYSRGALHITDRAGLLGVACECYEMQRLILSGVHHCLQRPLSTRCGHSPDLQRARPFDRRRLGLVTGSAPAGALRVLRSRS